MPLISPTRQRGAALLVSLLIAALVTITVTAMLRQQSALAGIEWQMRETQQVRRILQGAEDWALVILKEDARQSAIDHPGEPWAIPLKEGRLSDFLKSATANNAANYDSRVSDVWLSGHITDAQARYNLTRLALAQVPAAERALWLRVAAQAGVPAEIAQRAAARFYLRPVDATARDAAAPWQTPQTLAQLVSSVPELAPFSAALATLVVILPQATPININTAAPPLLQALLPALDEKSMARFIELRQRAPWRDVNAINGPFPELAGALDTATLSVASRYFSIHAAVRLQSGETQATALASHTLIERSTLDNRIHIVRRESGVVGQ